MEEQKLKEYSECFIQENAEPHIIKLPESKVVVNGIDTSNRHAWGGVDWINYWRALTKQYSPFVCCACCGKLLYADIHSEECINNFKIRQLNEAFEKIEDFQADGGHIKADFQDEYYDGFYIVPLCKEHNNRFSYPELSLREDSILCTEVGASVENNR